MKLEAILMANAATIDASSLLSVEGSCWRFVERWNFPETVGGSVCGVILIEDEDFGAVHVISADVFDDSGHVEGSSGSVLFNCMEPSSEMTTPRLAFAIPFATVIHEPTVLKASVKANGAELGALSVIVRRLSEPD
jgi:hypothetical protein